MKKENAVNALDEINKGACMGMDAIHFVIDKVKEKKLKIELENQYEKYQKISNDICKIYNDYEKTKEPHDTNAMNKVMTWYGIEMKTLSDDSTSKIAELIMQGTNMGIIEGRRILNDKKLDKEVHNIVQEYVTMQETAVDKLKQFL